MAHVNSQWIRRCIIEASEEDREYGVATVLGPTWQERTGEIYCNLIDRTHCIGCVLTAAALEYSVSNWTETLDGALVLVEDAALVLNREKAQFNLRVAMFQVMRTSTGRPMGSSWGGPWSGPWHATCHRFHQKVLKTHAF